MAAILRTPAVWQPVAPRAPGLGVPGLGALAIAAGVLCLAAAPALTPSIERGAEVAQARCASCHGVALEAASPSHDAPLFRVLSRLYSARDLERKLDSISRDGHFEMPAVTLREDEIEDVSAYIASLESDDHPVPPPRKQPTSARWPWTPSATGLRI